MRLLAPALLAMASTRAPVSPLAVNSAVAAARIAARVRSGSRAARAGFALASCTATIPRTHPPIARATTAHSCHHRQAVLYRPRTIGEASMKIVGFEAEGGLRLGVVEGDQVIDLQAVDSKVPADLGAVLAANNGDLKPLGDVAKRAPAPARRPLKGLKFGLPVARPGKIICLGLNYLDHVKEGPNRDNVPKFPSIFMRCLTSMVPHEQAIIRPKASEQLDYEAEMMLIVGKRAKHLTLANATSIVAGYSCSNEGSVRAFQRKTTQWDMGKNFDRTGGFGPWMVSADELPDGGKGLKI